MPRGFRRAAIALGAAAIGACSLFTDLSGLDGDPDLSPSPDAGTSSGDATTGPDDASNASKDSNAPDAGPYQPKFQASVTISNGAAVELPAGSTQCFIMNMSLVASQVRPDLADVRMFGKTTERARSIDVRSPNLVSACFGLESAIPPGGSAEYKVRYGDPNASPPPPAEPVLFPFYEPFDGTTLDTQRWLVNGVANVGGGTLTLPKGAQNGIASKAGQDGIPAVASLELRARVVDPSSGPGTVDSGENFHYWFGFQRKGDFVTGSPWSIFVARSAGSIRPEHNVPSGACASLCAGPEASQPADFRTYRIDRGATKTTFIDDLGVPFPAEGTNGDESVVIRNFLAASDLIVDWVRARPSVEPEPTVVLGSMEALP